jgi:adenylate kinase
VCDIDGGELYQRDDDQAETIANRLKVYANETAPLVGYYASRGLLVGIDATGPVDDVTIDMVRNRLAEPDARDGFLLDGFPRTVPQAQTLDDILAEIGVKLDVVLELVVENDEVVRRLSGRRTCRKCNHIWHIEFDPPATEGVCDLDGGELYQRDDDRPETIANRLDVYDKDTAPLVNYYAERGLLVGIDATGPVDDVTQRAIDALRPLQHGE